jgi:hypothetical protein
VQWKYLHACFHQIDEYFSGIQTEDDMKQYILTFIAKVVRGIFDKKYNVWNDIFLDTTDLHSHFRRQNYYGPVLFELSSDFIVAENYEIWITKKNPTEWQQTTLTEEKYFTSVEELKKDWHKYSLQKKMITIRNSFSPLPWKYLTKASVDDPNVMSEGTVYYSETVKALKSLISESEVLKGKFSTRVCSNCYCKSNYLKQISTADLNKLFLPL